MIDAWLNPVLLRLREGESASLCSLSHVKQTKAGEWGSELFGRVPDRSHWHICMWNRHFTPPHFLIVAKIICEIAFHQECFPRQLSHNLHAVGPQSWHTHLFFSWNVCAFLSGCWWGHFLNNHLPAFIFWGGPSTCCFQQQVYPNVLITGKVRAANWNGCPARV